MKNSTTKQIDRYEVKDVDLDEIELDAELDEVEEEEAELDWAVMENDAVDSVELDDDAEGLKKNTSLWTKVNSTR